MQQCDPAVATLLKHWYLQLWQTLQSPYFFSDLLSYENVCIRWTFNNIGKSENLIDSKRFWIIHIQQIEIFVKSPKYKLSVKNYIVWTTTTITIKIYDQKFKSESSWTYLSEKIYQKSEHMKVTLWVQ